MPSVPSLVDDTVVTEAENGVIPGDEFLKVVSPRGFDPDGPTHQTSAPFPGELIGRRYRLEDKLAQGAFGLVFRAHDITLDRVVALKILNPDHASKRDIVRRFLQEATAAARVVHPGVVTILDCGQFNGGAYIAMDLLDGESLTDRLEHSGRLLAHDAIEIARQIAAALETAHTAGVLHRDLKPDNIFLVSDSAMPDGLRVKLLDFGLAKVEFEDDGTSLSGPRRRTRVQSVFGTPRYMSPEQCRSSTNIDHRSDIYALGCILFELLTGAPPYTGEIDAVLAAHIDAPIPRVSTFISCTQQLDALIVQLLAKDPKSRLQSMTAVRRALDSLPLGRMGSSPAMVRTPTPRAALPKIMRPSAASQESTTRNPPLAGEIDVPARTPRDVPLPRLPRVVDEITRGPRSVDAVAPRIARGTTVPPPVPSSSVRRAGTAPPPVSSSPPLRGVGTVPPPIVKGKPAPRPTGFIAPPPGYVAPSASPAYVAPSAPPAYVAPSAPPAYVAPSAPVPQPPQFAPSLGSNRLPRIASSMPVARHVSVVEPMPLIPTTNPSSNVINPSATVLGSAMPVQHKLPPYFPKPPIRVSAPIPPTPVPSIPSMSTAMAMSMAYIPATPSGKAPSLQHAVAVPMGLPAPTMRSSFELDLEPPAPSRWPLVLVAIACALSGALAALMLA